MVNSSMTDTQNASGTQRMGLFHVIGIPQAGWPCLDLFGNRVCGGVALLESV